MADLNVSSDQVAAARSAGYSDQEIVNYLSPHAPDQFSTAIKAGYSPTEILQHLAPQPSGIIDSLRQGTADGLGGVGKTLEAFTGKGTVSTALQSAADSVAPKNYVPSSLVDSSGVHPANILPWLARLAPKAAAAVVAAGLAPEALGTAGAIGAAAGAGTLMSAGNEAQTAADNASGQPNSPITTPALVRGGLTAAGSNLVGALPVTRLLPSAGNLATTGAAGGLAALKKLAATAGLEGAASGASSVANQVGQTVGTPSGVNVDPTQVADATAGGAVTGGAFGALPAARASVNALKYRTITPDLQPAAIQFANRMQQSADGANLNAGVIGGGSALRAGADAFNKASAAVKSELGDAVSDLRSRVQLPTDANNVLNAALNGQQPNTRDYATLYTAVQGDPQASNVMNLVRQAHVADIVQNTGTLTDKKFVGGLSSIPTALSAHSAGKSALAAMGGAAIEGGVGHIMAYSPEVMTTLAGGAVAARLADRLTGARSPAGRFVDNFADGTTPVRQSAPVPQVTPGPPASPTGPKIPLAPTPWGTAQPVNPATVAAAQQKQQMVMAALPLLQRLAAQSKAVTLPAKFTSTLSNPGAQVVPLAAPAPAVPPSVLAAARGATITAKPAVDDATHQITGVTKTNGNVGTQTSADEYVIPRSPYANLVPSAAAQQFLADAQKGGTTINYKQGFINSTVRNITDIRNRAAAVASQVPSVNANEIAAQFEGVSTQKDAVAHREWLKRQMPQAAAALDQHFSDEAIAGTANKAGIWKRKGQ